MHLKNPPPSLDTLTRGGYIPMSLQWEGRERPNLLWRHLTFYQGRINLCSHSCATMRVDGLRFLITHSTLRTIANDDVTANPVADLKGALAKG